MHLFILVLLLLESLDDVLEVCVRLDNSAGAEARVSLLVLALLPQLREHLLVHLAALGLALFPLATILNAINLLVPAH